MSAPILRNLTINISKKSYWLRTRSSRFLVATMVFVLWFLLNSNSPSPKKYPSLILRNSKLLYFSRINETSPF